MKQSFLDNLRASFAPAGGWPADKIAAVLKRRYEKVNDLGREQGFTLYGIEDHGLHFVTALIAVEGAPDRVAEIAFLARFADFEISAGAVESMNRNLHISVAGLEGGGDLFLLAGVEATGVYAEATFLLLLDAWKRDLLLVLQVLSGRSSMVAASPIARSEAAMAFAMNRGSREAPHGSGAAPDLLGAYLSANLEKGFCNDCGGRGKRGFVARACDSCEGTGFAKKR